MMPNIGIDMTILRDMESPTEEEVVTLSIVDGICRSQWKEQFVFFCSEPVKTQMLARYRDIHVVGVKTCGKHFYSRFLPRYHRKQPLKTVYYPHCHQHIRIKETFRVIITVHGLFSKDLSPWEFWRTVTKIRKAGTIVAVSDFVRQELSERIKLNNQSIRVIPSALYDLRPGIHIVFKKKYLLTVNRDIPKENLISVVKAFDGIKEKIEHDLVIIGKMNKKSRIYRYIQKNDLTKRIIITGQMNRDTLFGYYRSADLFVSASRYEGFGLTALEVMTMSTRVLTTMTPALRLHPDILPDGLIQVSTRHTDIGKQILEILSTSSDQKKLDRRAALVRGRFVQDRMVSDYCKRFGVSDP